MLQTFLGIAITMVASGLGFRWARQFVTRRLRFVDAAQSRFAPILAGVVVAMLAFPLTFLPLIGAPVVVALGIGVGLGVASASRDIRLASYRIDR